MNSAPAFAGQSDQALSPETGERAFLCLLIDVKREAHESLC